MNRLIPIAGAVLVMGLVAGCGSSGPEPEAATTTNASSDAIPAGSKKTEGTGDALGAQAPTAAQAPDWAKTGTPGG